ncbi:hypothetical protein BDP27DRAFT_1331268 [Rhodocollybia butyracea]|uniref:Uncharacterized protein n=1 Tax=Rhodocollybia butyracea TaxID=206335 RepID=A0A9P5PME7_9AGAR|nr:hypothetical protein BDP27DRAFT_1331268 [Rhodocollybia butyracea]
MIITLAELDLISIFIECILYGFFLLLTVIVCLIIRRRLRSDHSGSTKGTLKILCAVLVMFFLATLHVSVHFYRTLFAYFTDLSGPARLNHIGEMDKLLVSVSSSGYALKTAAYYLQTYVGDAFVMYRVNVVWNGNKKVMFPLIALFLGCMGVSIYVLQQMTQESLGETIWESRLANPYLCFFILTLTINLSSTVLIAGRIHWIHTQVKDASQIQLGEWLLSLGPSATTRHRGVFVAGVILESGAIYSTTLLIALVLYALRIHTVYVLLDAITQLIGIVFAFIVIRIAIGISTEATLPPLRSSTELESPVSDRTHQCYLTHQKGSSHIVLQAVQAV